jgi:hypothetical protein
MYNVRKCLAQSPRYTLFLYSSCRGWHKGYKWRNKNVIYFYFQKLLLLQPFFGEITFYKELGETRKIKRMLFS